MDTEESVYFTNLEWFYLLAFDVVLMTYLPAAAIYAWVVWWHSPKEMSSFQLTATNTIVWVLLPVPYFTVFFKPMPILPFPMASVSGLVTLTNVNLYLAMSIGMLLAFNAIFAITVCLTMQFLSIKFPFFQRRIERRQGIAAVAAAHLIGSSIVALILLVGSGRSAPESELRTIVKQAKPALASFVDKRRLVGLTPTNGLGVLPTAVSVVVVLLTIQWMVMLVTTMRVVLQGFRRPNTTRCTVANILAGRTMVPVVLVSIPSIIVACLFNFEASASTLACVLIILQMFSPIVNYVIKIVAFKPYRCAVSGAFRRLSSRISSESNTSTSEVISGQDDAESGRTGKASSATMLTSASTSTLR